MHHGNRSFRCSTGDPLPSSSLRSSSTSAGGASSSSTTCGISLRTSTSWPSPWSLDPSSQVQMHSFYPFDLWTWNPCLSCSEIQCSLQDEIPITINGWTSLWPVWTNFARAEISHIHTSNGLSLPTPTIMDPRLTVSHCGLNSGICAKHETRHADQKTCSVPCSSHRKCLNAYSHRWFMIVICQLRTLLSARW